MSEPPVWGGPPSPGPDASPPGSDGAEPARPAGRHAAHRAPRRSLGERLERRYVLLAVAVVGLLIVGILAVGALSGGDDDPDALGTVSTSSTPTTSESVVSDPTTRATTTTPSPTSSPTATDGGRTDEPDDRKSGRAGEKTVAKVPVLVLNNSRITGLAARYADTVEDEGWSVTRTDNWTRTDLPRTTVFYAPGDKAAAQAFAKEFDFVAVVEPALSGMGPDLTLVLTSDAA